MKELTDEQAAAVGEFGLEMLVIIAESFAVSSMAEHPDATEAELATIVRMIREARRLLSDAERAFEAKLAGAMPGKLSSDKTFEKKWSPASTRWDSDYVMPRLAAAALDERILDKETGVIEPAEQAAMRIFREAAGVSYYRVGALKRLGIDVDNAREQEGGRWVIKFL